MSKREPGDVVWGHSLDEMPETWSNTSLTREAAIADGRASYKGHSHFFVVSGRVVDPSEYAPDADEILETASNRAAEHVGEAAEDWPPEVDQPAKDELTDLVAGWFRKHCPNAGGFWIQEGEAERIEMGASKS